MYLIECESMASRVRYIEQNRISISGQDWGDSIECVNVESYYQ